MTIEVDEPRRFSQSKLWWLTTDYYERQGAEAWTSGNVPYKVTCNAFIAQTYADAVLAWLRDLGRAEGDGRGPARLTVVELGAGAGQFGHLFLQAVRQASGTASPPSIRYFMTDVAESNVASWADNPRLRPWIDQGLLDIGILDVAKPADARSALSGRSLADLLGGEPVVVIANYLFDSLVSDAFRVEGGEIFEVKVGLHLDREIGPVRGTREVFEALRFTQEKAAIAWPYYPEPAFDAILQGYGRDLKATTLLFPLAGLRCLDGIRALAGGSMMLLLSDKARSDPRQLEGHSRLSLALTGSFSSTVNVDALARWFGQAGGRAVIPQPAKEHFDTYAFLVGRACDGAETMATLERRLNGFSPAAYWGLFRTLTTAEYALPPRALLALLDLCCYDPYVVYRLEEALFAAVGRADPEERRQFAVAFGRVLGNVFPDGHDNHLILGRLFQKLGLTRRALDCYAVSLAETGPTASVLHKMSLAQAELGDTDAALDTYRQAIAHRRPSQGPGAGAPEPAGNP